MREDNPTRFAAHKHSVPDESALRSPSAFEINIEELVLHGFKATDRYAIAEAVESELRSLLARATTPQLSRLGVHIDRLNAGTFTIVPDAPGRVVGTQLAQALHRSLAPPEANAPARGNKPTGKGSGPL